MRGSFLLLVSLLAACTADQFATSDAGDSGVSADAPSIEGGQGPDAGLACNLDAPFGSIAPLDSVNTSGDDSALRLTADGLYGVFQSNHSTSSYDLYATSRPSPTSAFGALTPLSTIVSTQDDTDPTLSSDGLTIYFASNRNGSFDLFTATRSNVSLPFTTPKSLSINTGADETQPYLANDHDLYFSKLSTTSSTFDVFHTVISSGNVSTPSFVAGVNSTDSDDDAPAVTPDGLTMYFASGRNGAQFDIFVSKRASTSTEFGAPTTVNELNDPTKDDRPSYISADGCTILFESNRTGGQNGFNIYVATKK